MEFASYPRMLHGQTTGNTEIRTQDLHIQRPMRYPFGHHVFTSSGFAQCCFERIYIYCNCLSFYYLLQVKRQILIQRRGASLALKVIAEDCGADLMTVMEYLWDSICGFLTNTRLGTLSSNCMFLLP